MNRLYILLLAKLLFKATRNLKDFDMGAQDPAALCIKRLLQSAELIARSIGYDDSIAPSLASFVERETEWGNFPKD